MSNNNQLNKGQKIGKWTLGKKISQGGNAFVWRVNLDKTKSYAMKILKKNKDTPVQRFKNEIETMQTFSSIDGILNVYDFDTSGEYIWFVMDLAKIVEPEKLNLTEKINGIRDISKVLEELHSKGYSHRDIKPDNILLYKKNFVLSDFGLVKYPDKEEITRSDQGSVGPVWTIAPEMRRDPREADGKKADVYSLAKTMWILLTEIDKGFDGQYIVGEVNSLKTFFPDEYLSSIEELMKDSTSNDPDKRPDITAFRKKLEAWLDEHSNFSKTNPKEWVDIQNEIFPFGVPKHAEWTNLVDIISILKQIAKFKSVVHVYLPTIGGEDLESVESSLEEDKIMLTAGETCMILKPKKLMFESFDDKYSRNYFRIVTVGFEPVGFEGAIPDDNFYPEEVVNINGKWYYQSEPEYFDEEASNILDVQERYYQGGDFLIVQKRSPYNLAGENYDGRHSKMSPKNFRTYVEENY